MTLEIPLWAAGPTGTEFQHSALLDRRLIEGMFDDMGGVIGSTAFQVVERAAGANMSVDVGPGKCVIPGMHIANQGSYYCRSTATVNRVVAAAPGTGTRTDLVVARVYDSEVQGLEDKFEIEVLTGTTTVPDDAIPLAEIAVASGTAAITNAMISDIRPHAMIRMELLMEYATKDFLKERTHREIRTVTSAGSVTFNIPSGIRVLRLGWVARSPASDFSANAWVRINGDTNNNYTYVRNVFDLNGFVAGESDGNNQSTVGMSAGVVSGAISQTESCWDGTILVGGARMRMTGTGFFRPGSAVRQVLSGGGYRVATQELNSVTFHVTGSGNKFDEAVLYVEGIRE